MFVLRRLYEIKGPVEMALFEVDAGSYRHLILIPSNWGKILNIFKFLAQYHNVTKFVSRANYATITYITPLLKTLERYRDHA